VAGKSAGEYESYQRHGPTIGEGCGCKEVGGSSRDSCRVALTDKGMRGTARAGGGGVARQGEGEEVRIMGGGW